MKIRVFAPLALFSWLLAPIAFGSLAALFPTDESYVEVAHAGALNPTRKMSLEAWVLPWSGFNSRCGTIISKNMDAGYWFGICKSQLTIATNGASSPVKSTGRLPLHEWVHVAVTFDGVWYRFYINGTLDSSVKRSGRVRFNKGPVMIGADTRAGPCSGHGCRFEGAISEVRLWKTARTQGQIRDVIDRHMTTPIGGLVAVWPLDRHVDDVIGGRSGVGIGARFDPALSQDFRGPYFLYGAPPVPEGNFTIPYTNLAWRTHLAPSLCSSFNYYPAQTPMWIDQDGRAAMLLMGANEETVLVCIAGLDTGSDAIIYLDPDADGGTFARLSDYRIVLTSTGSLRIEKGSGAGGFYTSFATLGVEAKHAIVGSDTWNAEFAIPRGLIEATPNEKFGLQVVVDDDRSSSTSGDWVWPQDGYWNRPSRYQRVVIDDTSPDVIRPDIAYSDNVQVHADGRHVFGVSVFDVGEWTGFTNGIKSITLDYDGQRMLDCAYERRNGWHQFLDARCERIEPGLFTVGTHWVDIVAVDHGGNVHTRDFRFVYHSSGTITFPDGPGY